MKKALIIGMAVMITATCAMAGNTKKTKIVAHRGYWKTESSAQNSIRAIVKADSIGVYGSEFDVWLTADNVLIVNHDDKIGNMVIEKSQSADILKQKLPNGENVPSLDDYLETAKKLGTRLVFEIKPHKDKTHEKKAVMMILDKMKKNKLTKRVDYITFSADALAALLEHAPKNTPIYYLNGEMTPEQLKKMGAAGMDYHINVYRKHPEWVNRCRQLGLKTNVWTVDKPEDMQWCLDMGMDYITTNEPVLLQKKNGEKE